MVTCWSCKENSTETAPPPTLAGHSPRPCVPSVTHITDPALLACKYLSGSNWVFKDSLGGGIDTLYVQELKRITDLMSSFSCDTLGIFFVGLSFKKESSGA